MANKTKAQLARTMFGAGLGELSAGQKAAVTRAFNAQEEEYDYEDDVQEDDETSLGVLTVSLGRPGVNGLKSCLVNEGATVKDVFDQSGFTMKPEKEGFIVKSSDNYPAGKQLKMTDKVFDGDVLAIVPGVDSSNN